MWAEVARMDAAEGVTRLTATWRLVTALTRQQARRGRQALLLTLPAQAAPFTYPCRESPAALASIGSIRLSWWKFLQYFLCILSG